MLTADMQPEHMARKLRKASLGVNETVRVSASERPAAADGTPCCVSALEQLNLFGHQIDLSAHRWECSACRGW